MEGTSIKKVLVTGGAGFIGSHVTELLCNKNFDVSVIDDLSFGYENFIDKRAKFIKGSIGDANLLERVVDGVDVVIHLAASSIISLSYQRPEEYFQNNLTNGVKLLETMRKMGVKKIINSSTAAVYGEQKKMPISEDAPKSPINIYGASKLAFEQALQGYCSSFDIESVSLRYFNAYGSRDEQKPATRAVPVWINAILCDKEIPLYWNGQQKRDYIFVKDIAQAHLDVMDLSGCNVFNIGSGSGVFMMEVLNVIEKILGKKAKIKQMGERKGDPMELIADTTKIRKSVNWKPRYNLEQGLKETIKYYESIYNSKLH